MCMITIMIKSISLTDFRNHTACRINTSGRHNIIITEDETFNLFYYLTQVNDKEFVDTIERVRNMLMDNPKLKELTPAMFLKEYRKVYPTRDV